MLPLRLLTPLLLPPPRLLTPLPLRPLRLPLLLLLPLLLRPLRLLTRRLLLRPLLLRLLLRLLRLLTLLLRLPSNSPELLGARQGKKQGRFGALFLESEIPCILCHRPRMSESPYVSLSLSKRF